MKVLLDTQIFIWWDSRPENLSVTALATLTDTSNIFVLSVVSIWEMQIKNQLGKLSLSRPLNELVESQQLVNSLEIMPIQAAHIFALAGLPTYHKAPFDRLLIAQAIAENMVLISADRLFSSYSVNLLQ
ncbi:MAG: type II toxin-antitoxin system VapC family toxin [Cyanosarcina radialis HA8281-LM2]|nr:type II toxin-antitoxin system VapC family toxin [Cyanosarcina radialis HA8281-LM2]